MKVLVTGATGFVGGHLVDRLLARGDAVTALVRSPARAVQLADRGVRLVVGDLANIDALREAVAGQQLVYHAAALLGATNEPELMAVNRDGTSNLATACTLERQRLILISSMAAGGPSRHGAPKRTNDDDHPVTMYGRSKLAAERQLATLPVSFTVIRPPVVYGPRDREGFLPLFRAVKYGVAPTFGDGSMEVSLIHVADLVEAVITAGTRADLNEDSVFYVNHPEIVTARELIRRIAQVMDRSPVPVPIPRWLARAALELTGTWADLFERKSILRADKVNEFYQEAWTADPSRFVAATGWQPTFDLRSGLTDTLDWYRKTGWV